MSYLTRVELTNFATDADYRQLHTAMTARGFAQTITGSNGITYRLPPAEYSGGNAASVQGVLQLAKQAAATTGKPHRVITTEGVSYWDGLEQVAAARRA